MYVSVKHTETLYVCPWSRGQLLLCFKFMFNTFASCHFVLGAVHILRQPKWGVRYLRKVGVFRVADMVADMKVDMVADMVG